MKKKLTIHYFLYIYHLRATINHEGDHFTTTIIDSSNRLFMYNDLHGVKEVQRSDVYPETAVYILDN